MVRIKKKHNIFVDFSFNRISTNQHRPVDNYSAGKRDRGKTPLSPLPGPNKNPLVRAKEGPKAPTQAQ